MGQIAIRTPDDRLPIGDADALLSALGEADAPTLMAVLVHLTKDESWLERCAPYIRPLVQDGAPNPGGGAQIPKEVAGDLKARLVAVLTGAVAIDPSPVDPALFQRIASAYMGEGVGDEFIECVIEQCGFARSLEAERSGKPVPPKGFRVLIVGAGMSGMSAAFRLGSAGYDYQVFEANRDIGGTWYENTYPGVAVDTPSHFYSFSYELNADWSHYFSAGNEVQAYLRHCARKYGLYERTTFGTEVLSMVYDEDRAIWTVSVRSKLTGEKYSVEANAVITASGYLNGPVIPDFDGLADCQVPHVHSARWHPGIDLAGKRVALVGTGCSAMQIGVALDEQVEHLTIFQRSPHWMNPGPHVKVNDGMKWALRHIPHFAEWFRFRTYWLASDGNYVNVKADPDWHLPEVSVSRHNEAVRQRMLAHFEASLADRPDLLAKVIPTYPPYGKRNIKDIGWLALIKKDHVELEASGIERIVADGIVSKDGRHHQFDFIIFATGFQHSHMLYPMHIVGSGGITIRQVWGREDPRAYRGVAVPGFPNMFVTAGPNSAPNHGAGVNFIAEAQANYIIECLDALVERSGRSIAVKRDAFEDYNRVMDNALGGLVWSHKSVRSYYVNSKGRVVVCNPWRLVDYWKMMRKPVISDFDIEPQPLERAAA